MIRTNSIKAIQQSIPEWTNVVYIAVGKIDYANPLSGYVSIVNADNPNQFIWVMDWVGVKPNDTGSFAILIDMRGIEEKGYLVRAYPVMTFEEAKQLVRMEYPNAKVVDIFTTDLLELGDNYND